MSEQMHKPDDTAETMARVTKDERQAVADGDAPGSTSDQQTADESSYAGQDVQGAAQPEPDDGQTTPTTVRTKQKPDHGKL